MSKKVLILSSSPRKGGNSGIVCADGVYERGAINGTKFIAEAKALGKGVE